MWGYGVDFDYDIRVLVAKRVKALRTRAGLRSRDLSIKLGYGHSFISEVERLNRELSYHAIWKLADLMQVSVEAIVGPPRTKEEHAWIAGRAEALLRQAATTGKTPGRRPRGD